MTPIIYTKNLSVDIYVIGYGGIGESIFFCIYTDEAPYFCAIIDSYYSTENRLLRLLNELGISTIDMLFWSHPHEDHSVGLEDYIPFLDRNSIICLPNRFPEYREDWISANHTFFEFCENEARKRPGAVSQYNICEVLSHMSIPHRKIQRIQSVVQPLNYEFVISTFAPDSFHYQRHSYRDNISLLNEMSIGLTLQLGEATLVFASDVPNVVFRNMQPGTFSEYVDYLKIPHHGSITSLSVLEKITGTINTSCSTVYSRFDLPSDQARDAYARRSNSLFFTSNKNATSDIGIIKTHIDVTDVPMFNTDLLFGAVSNNDYRL